MISTMISRPLTYILPPKQGAPEVIRGLTCFCVYFSTVIS